MGFKLNGTLVVSLGRITLMLHHGPMPSTADLPHVL